MGMGQEGVEAGILPKENQKETDTFIGYLWSTEEPFSCTACARESSFLISSSSEWAQLPPYLCLLLVERDYVIRRTETATHILRRA